MCKFTFAVVADLHLTKKSNTAQYAAFHWAIEDINLRCPDFAVITGDNTAYGDKEAIAFFKEKVKSLEIPYRVVIGNSDIRTEETIPEALTMCDKATLECMGRKIVCVNTADTHIYEDDRNRISACGDGDILIMHHNMDALDEDSKIFLSAWAKMNKGLIIHGHNHRDRDYMVGQTRCIGIRCMDPDKAIGKGPCFVYFTIDGDEVQMEECPFMFSHSNVRDFRDKLGISCFDIYQDIDFAMENKLKNIEIRKFDGSDEELVYLKDKVGQWRKDGGNIVSVHMPNLYWNGEGVDGLDKWNDALRIVKALDVETVTIHPPRFVCIKDMTPDSHVWNRLVGIFAERIKDLPLTTKAGIENIHFLSKDISEEERYFGYLPEEILSFVDALNTTYGYERVGTVFDIGHARNNGPLFRRNVLSDWFGVIGKKTTAYHIHQSIPTQGRLQNHTAITDWAAAPSICFVSFIWAWQMNVVNHCPMFMEMRTKENCKISLEAFDAYSEKFIYQTEENH